MHHGQGMPSWELDTHFFSWIIWTVWVHMQNVWIMDLEFMQVVKYRLRVEDPAQSNALQLETWVECRTSHNSSLLYCIS